MFSSGFPRPHVPENLEDRRYPHEDVLDRLHEEEEGDVLCILQYIKSVRLPQGDVPRFPLTCPTSSLPVRSSGRGLF